VTTASFHTKENTRSYRHYNQNTRGRMTFCKQIFLRPTRRTFKSTTRFCSLKRPVKQHRLLPQRASGRPQSVSGTDATALHVTNGSPSASGSEALETSSHPTHTITPSVKSSISLGVSHANIQVMRTKKSHRASLNARPSPVDRVRLCLSWILDIWFI